MRLLIITQTVDDNDQLLGFFTSWVMRFARKFESVNVLCLNENKNILWPSNVRIVCLGKSTGVSKPVQLLSFYKNIFSLNYDAVFVHMNPIWVILGGPAWRLLNKKIFFWYTHKAVTPKLKIAEKFAHVIFTASKESFRLSSKKIVVTGHGVDTELFRPSDKRQATSDKLKILSVGRIAPVKNYETLIDAAKILKNQGVEFLVTMVGEKALGSDKEYEIKIKNKIKELELEKNFNFVGKVINKELPSYYQSHDVFVHLSKTGSLDKTILEAMACGMRVLSSNDASRPFLSSESVFKENDRAELAKKIIIVSKSKEENLREYVIQNHNLEKLINKISSTILD